MHTCARVGVVGVWRRPGGPPCSATTTSRRTPVGTTRGQGAGARGRRRQLTQEITYTLGRRRETKLHFGWGRSLQYVGPPEAPRLCLEVLRASVAHGKPSQYNYMMYTSVGMEGPAKFQRTRAHYNRRWKAPFASFVEAVAAWQGWLGTKAWWAAPGHSEGETDPAMASPPCKTTL